MLFLFSHYMKKLGFLFCIVFVFSACQKENTNNTGNNLSAETFSNVAYGSDAAQKMDIYLPAGRHTDSTKMIIMVHGGAWAEGDKAEFDIYVTVLKQRLPNYAIANINYRLATAAANPFPAQENDMKAAINFLVQKSTEYHITQKFVLLGASAGAHMAMLQAYKYTTPKIKAVVSFFGPANMVALYNASTPTAQFGLQVLLGGTPATNAAMYQQSSPINFIDAQTSPTIIFHGDADVIVNVSQSTAIKNKLQTFGIVNQLTIYPGLGHEIWPAATMTDAFNKIEAFIKANVN